MAILSICTFPDPVLNKPCHEVELVDADLRRLASHMLETMYEAPGVGLAAPQVGESIKLVVVDWSKDETRGEKPLILFNPKIVSAEGVACVEEGCLSLPGFLQEVDRAGKVVVNALNQEGKPVTITAEGFPAIVLQHEIDHLSGRLLLDHTSPLKRNLYKKRRFKQIRREQS